jgi:Nucleotidyltransferase of unknown function (DUF6036)
MPTVEQELWSLIWGRPEVDPTDLATAVSRAAPEPDLDYRTRVLIHDSADALEDYWGHERWTKWLAGCGTRSSIESIRGERFDKVGFPLLRERLVDKTDPETVIELLRELGVSLSKPVRLAVGGSAALILRGLISRFTTDIDVVDEVPSELRSQHGLLKKLRSNYHLQVTHFGSHYLPSSWDQRLQFFQQFGHMRVELVDPYDIFLGKLFSKRDKDFNDLRALKPQLDKAKLAERLKETTAALQRDPELLSLAKKNWYILFGEDFPQ